MDYVKIIIDSDGIISEEPTHTNYGYNTDVFWSSDGIHFVVYHKTKVEKGKKKLLNYLEKELKRKIKPLLKQLKTIQQWKNSNKSQNGLKILE